MVLEGRDRVGGRSFTGGVAGLPVDLGGTFVGPTQDAVLALAAELDVPTTPTYHDGQEPDPVARLGRAPTAAPSPSCRCRGLLDIGRVRWQFDRIARGVPVATPWDARRARRSSTTMSLGEWLRSVRAQRLVARPDGHHGPGDVGVRTRRGVDAARRPLRHGPPAVWTGMLDVDNGAQQDRFPGGTQQIAAGSGRRARRAGAC